MCVGWKADEEGTEEKARGLNEVLYAFLRAPFDTMW